VTINARTEDDVDEELVITKVARASGANYSFHREEKKPMPAVEPVVCVFLFHFFVTHALYSGIRAPTQRD